MRCPTQSGSPRSRVGPRARGLKLRPSTQRGHPRVAWPGALLAALLRPTGHRPRAQRIRAGAGAGGDLCARWQRLPVGRGGGRSRVAHTARGGATARPAPRRRPRSLTRAPVNGPRAGRARPRLSTSSAGRSGTETEAGTGAGRRGRRSAGLGLAAHALTCHHCRQARLRPRHTPCAPRLRPAYADVTTPPAGPRTQHRRTRPWRQGAPRPAHRAGIRGELAPCRHFIASRNSAASPRRPTAALSSLVPPATSACGLHVCSAATAPSRPLRLHARRAPLIAPQAHTGSGLQGPHFVPLSLPYSHTSASSRTHQQELH